MKNYLGIGILIALFTVTVANAQSNLEKGWQAFYKNDRKAARELFMKAANEVSSKGEARLALMFINEVEGKEDAGFMEFQNFFKASDNPYPYLFAFWHSSSVFGYDSKKNPKQLDFLN